MAILPESTVEVVEDESHVSPPPGSVPATSISLTFFDIIYLVTIPVDCNWMQRLFFYESKHSAADFIGNILPGLKASLSLTLQRFFPFAGIVVFPPPPRMPYIVFAEGDSVLFVVKESSVDFDHLVGDHARDHDGFLSLVPRKPPAIERMSFDGCRQEPAMAVQVTVFPNAGFSIGVGFSHNVADGMTFAHFMKSWASIHRNRKAPDDHLPIFDRDSIDDPLGLAPLLMNNIGMTLQGTISPNSSFNNLRVTFKIKRSQIESLKTEVKTKCNELNGSTFVVACAYIWVCLTKLHRSSTHSDELSYFHFPADCRAHLNLPQTYFGNCLTLRLTSAKRSELLSENGFPVAAIAIEREITEFRKQPFKDATKSLLKTIEKNKTEKDIVLLVSSPKFGLYDTDFGWGKPRKTEVGMLQSIGRRSMVCTSESRDEEGGVEFGLGFASHDSVNSFNDIFMEGLSN